MSISTLVFRPGLWNLYPFSLRNSWGWLVASLLRLERQQKRFLKIHFELAHFSFFLIHSELIRWINTFIHTRSFLENHTISVYPCSDPTPKGKRLSIKSGFSFNVIIKSILRKQATFRDDTTGFPAKWRLRNERRNSILMTRHYPDLGSDTSSVRDFLLRSFLRCCYAGKPVVASQNVGSFLRLIYSRLSWSTQWTPKIQQ